MLCYFIVYCLCSVFIEYKTKQITLKMVASVMLVNEEYRKKERKKKIEKERPMEEFLNIFEFF